jgi:serine acetyltransferase
MDFDIYHKRRWPGRPMCWFSRLWLLMSSPGLRLLLMHRISYHSKLKRKNGGWCAWFWIAMVIPLAPLKLAIKINSKSYIAEDAQIEGGVCFSDDGQIIYGATKTGFGTVIGTRVTIGESSINVGRPEIGCNVWIGSDSVAYGAVKIGNGVTLLPNTILSKSIPSNVVMQGNPARLVQQNFDNAGLRKSKDADPMEYIKIKLKET